MTKYPAHYFAYVVVRSTDISGYGENGQPIGKAFVIGIAGEFILPILNG